MKKWILKAIVQKTISYLPFGNKVNYLFQKYITKGVYLTDEYFYDRLGHAKAHIEAFATYSPKKKPDSCLELGTGWYPIVPISFYLIGVSQIYSIDISFLTSKERIKTTIEQFIAAHDAGKLAQYLPFLPEKYASLLKLYQQYEALSLEEILKQLQLTYLIEDARKSSLANDSIDLVNSNNTFEHIYPEILMPILADFKRVVNKKQGVMSHFIDMSDHFAHFDKSINIYNFLQFSETQWQRIDNSIQPQSRLRIDDYQAMYESLKLPITYQTYREGNLAGLKTVTLAEMYAKKPLETVAISHCHFVSDMRV
ncbi:MAG: class I SAM-dependent methyltransferase [Bacteroidia bacterium]